MQWKSLTLLLIGATVGCMDATKIAPAVVDLGPNLNVDMLQMGRGLYLNRCTKCHNALRITRYPLQEWREDILPEMAEESMLSVEEETALTAYIEAVIAIAE